MTVIAWHLEHGIAVDSQSTTDERCNIEVKKYLIVDGVFYAGTGRAHMVELAFECITDNKRIEFDLEDTAIIAFKFATEDSPAQVRQLTTGSQRFLFTSPVANAAYDAIGSGSSYANAALAYGKNPGQAVAIACKYCTGCGGKARYFNLYGSECEYVNL